MSDLISREKIIYAVRNLDKDFISQNKMLLLLTNFSSAEPDLKKGKWIDDFCSCCGISKYYFLRMVDDECAPFGTWNFCPNCGADMRGE